MAAKFHFFNHIDSLQFKTQEQVFNRELSCHTDFFSSLDQYSCLSIISSYSLIYTKCEVPFIGKGDFHRISNLETEKKSNQFRSFFNHFKMICFKLCLAISLISYSFIVNAQSTLKESDIQEMLVGTWHVASTSTLPEADTLGLRLQPEEVIYMIFEENNANLRFSSFINNDSYEGAYKIQYNRKSKDYGIILKKTFGSCETKSVQIVSITDTSLIIRSCINPVHIIFKKSPPPSERIKNVKNILIGSWNYVKTIRGENYLVSNPLDSLVSYEFSEDSVIIYFKKNNQTIVRKSNYIIYCDNLDLARYSIYTPNFIRESCDTFQLFYILSIDRNSMISERCDNDHINVIYQKL